MSILTAGAGLALAAWVYLLLFHGRYWHADARLDRHAGLAPEWPPVVAVVPARNEREVIGAAVRTLIAQDYPGRFDVIVVDDHSDDGTADGAREAAAALGGDERLAVVGAPALPEGWMGKLWAVNHGLDVAKERVGDARYVLLTDADIAHAPDALRHLVAKAETEGRDLVSLMVVLTSAGPWAALLLPAFVYFFQMLYPFPRVNDPKRKTAAAAGGCMLVRRDALAEAGGIAAIRGALIDDCALARQIKHRGEGRHPIWLGLAEDSHSIRPYEGLRGIWDMVARSAYTQLRHSRLMLTGTVLGMLLLYLLPPVAFLWGLLSGSAVYALLGGVAWALMAASFVPTVRLYRRPLWVALLLPAAGVIYTAMTVDSALRHWRGEGGKWKGRVYPAKA